MFGLRFTAKDFFYMFVAGLFFFIVLAISRYAISSSVVHVNDENPEAQKILNNIEEDFIIGSEKAPIQVVFYGDFTCHHCMRFVSDTFQRLRDEYIFTEKVQFVFRPIITLKRSLFGSKFLFCEKRDDVINSNIFFEMFEKKWMMSDDYLNALLKIVKNNKWDTPEHFQECMNSKKIKENLKNIYYKTIKPLNIHETPHVYVDRVETLPDKTIFAVIDKAYAKWKKKQK